MSPRRLGISNYLLFRRRHVVAVDDDEAARLLLEQFKGDPGAMRDLRMLLDESMLGIPNTRLTDDEVVDGIARLLGAGELVLVREWPAHGGSATQPTISGQGDAPAGSPPPTSGSSSQGPENPTLPSNTNGATQAATLAAAAASGAPFCAH